MTDKILCVDDDPNILEGFKRQLRKEFELATAVGPEQGLRMVTEQGPFAVVVSDLQMPGMNGIEFLAQVRTHEPDTVRMLSQIGCVILPESVLKKVYRGEVLTGEESQPYNQHPFIAYDLIAKIPRMKRVAEIIKFQDKYYDGVGIPGDSQQGNTIPMEARILKVALDFDALESSCKSKAAAFGEMQQRKGWYDPAVIDALKTAFAKEIKYEVKTTVVADLLEGMILAEDIQSSQNVLLASKGQQVTQSMILRLQSFKKSGGIREPFTVLLPMKLDDIVAAMPSQASSPPMHMLKAS